jgi:hypothetical protein
VHASALARGFARNLHTQSVSADHLSDNRGSLRPKELSRGLSTRSTAQGLTALPENAAQMKPAKDRFRLHNGRSVLSAGTGSLCPKGDLGPGPGIDPERTISGHSIDREFPEASGPLGSCFSLCARYSNSTRGREASLVEFWTAEWIKGYAVQGAAPTPLKKRG